MTQASILGPPRTGKKVLSEQEFFEQMKDCQNDTQHNPPEVEPRKEELKTSTPTTTSAHPYFIYPGRFNVGSIEQIPRAYIFHDLELPMGSWKRLIMYEYNVAGESKYFHQLAAITESIQPKGVSPIDICYGLMAVSYLNKDDPRLKEIIPKIRHDFDLNARFHSFSSTKVVYRERSLAMVHPGIGWSPDHPFDVSYKAGIASQDYETGEDIATYGGSNSSIENAIFGLLGERDLDRCSNVLKWICESDVAFLRRLSRTSSLECGAVFANDGKIGIHVKTDCLGPSISPALFIQADPQDYQ